MGDFLWSIMNMNIYNGKVEQWDFKKAPNYDVHGSSRSGQRECVIKRWIKNLNLDILSNFITVKL